MILFLLFLCYLMFAGFVCFLFLSALFGVASIVACVAVEATTEVVDEVDRTVSKSIKRNNGSIDGAKMKFGKDCEISVEGPDTSFSKWCKYMWTGEKEYSTKLKVKGKEIGKFNTNGSNNASFKINEKEIQRQLDKALKKLK